jgi:hypothetical protein
MNRCAEAPEGVRRDKNSMMAIIAGSLEKAGRTILSYGIVLVRLWFEGTQFAQDESRFL